MKKTLSAARWYPLAFFIGLLAIGVFIHRDYGLSWDEPSARFRGILNFQYVFGDNPDLLRYESRYHGPAFELVLLALELASGLRELREIYFLRHLATFLLFVASVFCFYRLCAIRFDSWQIGLLGAGFYVVSPRIFADAFYNSKDGAFLALFVIAMYTLMRYLDRPTIWRALTHALACGFLIAIRILGGLVPFFTYLLVCGAMLATRPSAEQIKRAVLFLLVYTVFTVNVVLLCFPVLWEDPVQQFLNSFVEMKAYNWVGTMLYFGDYFAAPDLPWHYALVWMAITTPLLYVGGLLIGAPLGLISILRHGLGMFRTRERRYELMFWLWGLFPLAVILGMGAVVYDGWRHLFFVYPGLLAVALHGLVWLRQALAQRLPGGARAYAPWLTAGVVAVSLASPAWFMIRHHPYQNLYFNRLAGADMAGIKQQFDLDYWGLSYREGLEYIVNTDPRPQIRVNDPNLWASHRLHILTEADRQRIVLVDSVTEADYFISNYRWHPDDYPYANEVFAVKVRGERILVVYAAPFE
jgi:hypothetical protein